VLKAVLVVGAVILVLVVAIVAVGALLPRAHVATREAQFTQPSSNVFAILQDVERYSTWRSDLRAVDVLSRAPVMRWREQGRDGAITFELQEAVAPRRLVTRIADPSLPFGGTWTFVLTSNDRGTRLTITEHGEVYNPLFRFMARFVFGHTATLERFLGDLGRYVEKS
jgi:uncharacterized protein YndB with AHSA1/START domain